MTPLPRMTVDFDRLIKALLAYPGLTVEPSVDISSLDNLPLLTYQGFNGHMIRNGYPAAGWQWTLALALFVGGLSDGNSAADTVYQIVHGMESQHLPGVGSVSSVEDIAMFDRVGGATLPDKQIVHYRASFSVVVRPA